eukprot:GFUD01067042.1.p1 GENE.GFUD01067042.1~~GFUD01067042.1.p1  ORF type:complete len:193 (+),score=37.90 GFUD01067042.1:32-610(+)
MIILTNMIPKMPSLIPTGSSIPSLSYELNLAHPPLSPWSRRSPRVPQSNTQHHPCTFGPSDDQLTKELEDQRQLVMTLQQILLVEQKRLEIMLKQDPKLNQKKVPMMQQLLEKRKENENFPLKRIRLSSPKIDLPQHCSQTLDKQNKDQLNTRNYDTGSSTSDVLKDEKIVNIEKLVVEEINKRRTHNKLGI